jgi:uncharacterized membrane protein YkoI
MRRQWFFAVGCAALVILVGGFFAVAQNKAANEEQERKVKEAEVPKAALEALKKLAGKAAITEYAEEVDHGHKSYEASWMGPDGTVDALVTESGDLVEIEEIIPAEKAPTVVRAASEKVAGKDVKLTFEKKTTVMYEVHFKKGDKEQEAVFTPDGHRYEEGGKKGEKDKDDHGD